MLGFAPFELCGWTVALAAFATIAFGLVGGRSAARYAVAASLAAFAVAFGLAPVAGLTDVSTAAAADVRRADRAVAPIRPHAVPSEDRAMLVAQVVSALAATPGLAEAVRIRLAAHEPPPAAAYAGDDD